jgi:hypothetical protein
MDPKVSAPSSILLNFVQAYKKLKCLLVLLTNGSKTIPLEKMLDFFPGIKEYPENIGKSISDNPNNNKLIYTKTNTSKPFENTWLPPLSDNNIKSYAQKFKCPEFNIENITKECFVPDNFAPLKGEFATSKLFWEHLANLLHILDNVNDNTRFNNMSDYSFSLMTFYIYEIVYDIEDMVLTTTPEFQFYNSDIFENTNSDDSEEYIENSGHGSAHLSECEAITQIQTILQDMELHTKLKTIYNCEDQMLTADSPEYPTYPTNTNINELDKKKVFKFNSSNRNNKVYISGENIRNYQKYANKLLYKKPFDVFIEVSTAVKHSPSPRNTPDIEPRPGYDIYMYFRAEMNHIYKLCKILQSDSNYKSDTYINTIISDFEKFNEKDPDKISNETFKTYVTTIIDNTKKFNFNIKSPLNVYPFAPTKWDSTRSTTSVIKEYHSELKELTYHVGTLKKPLKEASSYSYWSWIRYGLGATFSWSPKIETIVVVGSFVWTIVGKTFKDTESAVGLCFVVGSPIISFFIQKLIGNIATFFDLGRFSSLIPINIKNYITNRLKTFGYFVALSGLVDYGNLLEDAKFDIITVYHKMIVYALTTLFFSCFKYIIFITSKNIKKYMGVNGNGNGNEYKVTLKSIFDGVQNIIQRTSEFLSKFSVMIGNYVPKNFFDKRDYSVMYYKSIITGMTNEILMSVIAVSVSYMFGVDWNSFTNNLFSHIDTVGDINKILVGNNYSPLASVYTIGYILQGDWDKVLPALGGFLAYFFQVDYLQPIFGLFFSGDFNILSHFLKMTQNPEYMVSAFPQLVHGNVTLFINNTPGNNIITVNESAGKYPLNSLIGPLVIFMTDLISKNEKFDRKIETHLAGFTFNNNTITKQDAKADIINCIAYWGVANKFDYVLSTVTNDSTTFNDTITIFEEDNSIDYYKQECKIDSTTDKSLFYNINNHGNITQLETRIHGIRSIMKENEDNTKVDNSFEKGTRNTGIIKKVENVASTFSNAINYAKSFWFETTNENAVDDNNIINYFQLGRHKEKNESSEGDFTYVNGFVDGVLVNNAGTGGLTGTLATLSLYQKFRNFF